jgi:hypothetical protein
MDQLLPLGRESFEQILATAWLLQQLQKRAARLGSEREDTPLLADLADTQQAIQTGALSPEAALFRIAELALELVPAQGAGVWLFAGDAFVYRAGAGNASTDERLRASVLSRLAACQGSADSGVNEESLRGSPVKSLLVSPIYQGSRIAGALAVFSENANSFSERDVTSARLLTGLLAHAVDKAASAKLKHTVTLERAVVLHVIESLVPSLAELVRTTPHPQGWSSSTITSGENGTLNEVLARRIESRALAVAENGVSADDRSEVDCAEVDYTEELRDLWPVFGVGQDYKVVEEVPQLIQETGLVPKPARIEGAELAILLAAPEQPVCAHEAHGVPIEAFQIDPPQIQSVLVQSVPSQALRILEADMIAAEESSACNLSESMPAEDVQESIRASSPWNRPSSWPGNWRPSRDWFVKVIANASNQLQAHGSRAKLLFHSTRIVKLVKRAGVATILFVALAFLIPKAPKAQPKILETTTPSTTPARASQPKPETIVLETSHKRVTDAATSSALQDLSRFEIPGLLRQASFGDDSAAFTLGIAYETGRGVRQDCARAAHWVREAANEGNAAAAYNLGLRYRDGDGVATNAEESEKWIRKAAARKYSAAHEALGALGALASNQSRASLSQP